MVARAAFHTTFVRVLGVPARRRLREPAEPDQMCLGQHSLRSPQWHVCDHLELQKSDGKKEILGMQKIHTWLVCKNFIIISNLWAVAKIPDYQLGLSLVD